MNKYKISFRRKRIAIDEKVVFLEANTKKEVEELLKNCSMDDLIKKHGSIEVSKGKVTEEDWKPSVSKA